MTTLTETDLATHHFTLIFQGPDVLEDERYGALLAAGCDDALFGERDGVQFAEFDRVAETLAEAVRSAVRDVTTAVPEIELVRVEPDDLVSMAEIAKRAEFSREYVRLLAKGERGPGGFPPPVAQVDQKTRLWRWAEVASWLASSLGREAQGNASEAEFIASLNAALELRQHAAHLRGTPDLQIIAELAPGSPISP